MTKKVEALDSGLQTFSSIMNTIPVIEDSSSNYLHEMYALRDDFFSKIPEESKIELVRSSWQELWAKAMLSMTPEQLKRLGEAFVFAAVAHKDQKRKSGEPYITHTLPEI